MPTFQDAYNHLMESCNRPLSQVAVLARAKAELNNSIMLLQRRHAFRHTEKLFEATYTGGSRLVDFGTVCTGTLRDIKSVQMSGEGLGGPYLKYKTYDQIAKENFRYQQSQGDTSLFSTEVRNLSDYVTNAQKFYFFVMGNSFGLFPKPVVDVPLLINCHIWLPLLSGNDDTNFFLTYAFDVVQDLALSRMATFLRNDDLKSLSADDLEKSIVTLINWDSQLHESTLTDPNL